MNNLIKEKQQQILDKQNSEKLQERNIYIIEIGYNRYSTFDKEKAFKIWEILIDNFFMLDLLNSNSNQEPFFQFKKSLEIKISGCKNLVWKTKDDAIKAFTAFKAIKNLSKKKQEVNDLPF